MNVIVTKLSRNLKGIRDAIILELREENLIGLPKEVKAQIDHFDMDRSHICEMGIYIDFPSHNLVRGIVVINYSINYFEEDVQTEGFMELRTVLHEGYKSTDFMLVKDSGIERFYEKCVAVKNSLSLIELPSFRAIKEVTFEADNSLEAKEVLVHQMINRKQYHL